ncbi:MAG: DUF2314 domain-containing protein [Phycisphaerales bacterium]
MVRACAVIILSAGMMIGALGCERERSATVIISDIEMREAESRARATLPMFLQAYASPEKGAGGFQVRHEYTNQAGYLDSIWLDLQSINDAGRLVCIVPDDEDERVIPFELGQEIIAHQSSINDWLFIDRDGTFVGGYTLRVTLDRIGNTYQDDEDMHGGIRFRDLDDE